MKKMTEQDGSSLDMVNDNLKALKAIFPEAFTEDLSASGDGQAGGVDFEVLRQLLGDSVDEGEEKYGLNWHGKKKARQIALMPSLGTLRPCPEESAEWDTTQNLFIEGDNLEVLKLLQKSYANKVKMIYIDPPYNTGKEFIYPDKFQDNLDTYLKYAGLKDDVGNKTSSMANNKNTIDSARYHTNWLNMMYPRLKLAKNLIKDDGVIFVSIDDCEVDNLKKICDEVFGEDNFLNKIVLENDSRARPYGSVATTHEYILVYSKFYDFIYEELIDDNKEFKFKDNEGGFDLYELRNRNIAFNINNRPNLYYAFWVNPNTKDDNDLFELSLTKKNGWIEVYPQESQGIKTVWRWGKKKASQNLNSILFGKKASSDTGFQIVKKYRAKTYTLNTVWTDKDIKTDRGTLETKALFDNKKYFDFPKPVSLIKRILTISTEKDSIVLDFFAGSSTTAHAVLQHNAEDGGNRQFFMVQLPEPCDEKSEAFKAGYKTIAEISKERIRRAAAKIKEENPEYEGDLGFKVFKLGSSNIRVWNPDRSDLEQTLLDHMEHLVEGRSEEDVLYELLLKRGVDLTVPIEEKTITGKTVYSIGYGVLFACLNTKISGEEVEDLAMGIIDWHKELEPASDTQVVFRDSAFVNDIAKTNMTAILEQHGIAHVRSL